MEPISMLILAAVGLLGGAATAGAVVIGVLTLPAVRAWFDARRTMTALNPDLVATTIVDLMASGSYRTVQGVFNTRTRTWVDFRTVDSHRIDAGLARLHRHDRVVRHTL